MVKTTKKNRCTSLLKCKVAQAFGHNEEIRTKRSAAFIKTETEGTTSYVKHFCFYVFIHNLFVNFFFDFGQDFWLFAKYVNSSISIYHSDNRKLKIFVRPLRWRYKKRQKYNGGTKELHFWFDSELSHKDMHTTNTHLTGDIKNALQQQRNRKQNDMKTAKQKSNQNLIWQEVKLHILCASE